MSSSFVGPVELVPARRVAVRLGDVLQRGGRGGADHDRHPERGRGARGRQLAVRVDERLHPDRARAAPAPASRCRAPPCAGRARRRRAACAGRCASGGRPRGSRASCPRCRRRRRRRRRPAARSPARPPAPARPTRPASWAARPRASRARRSRGSSRRMPPQKPRRRSRARHYQRPKRLSQNPPRGGSETASKP